MGNQRSREASGSDLDGWTGAELDALADKYDSTDLAGLLQLQLPAEVIEALEREARARGTTPGDLAADWLRERLAQL